MIDDEQAIMQRILPIFESHDRFLLLNHSDLSQEQPGVVSFLASFDNGLKSIEGYKAVRGFLRSYEGNVATFNSYRTHVERLLLWSLLVSRKPILELTRQDGERFMEFCISPPVAWIGPVVKARWKRVGGRIAKDTDTWIVNSAWRPFYLTSSKREKKLASERSVDVGHRPYRMAQDTVAQVFAVCGSFYQFVADEGLTSHANPIRAIKQKSKYKQRVPGIVRSKALTDLQWHFVLDTARLMAAEDPRRHERTLFILSTLYSMYLRVSDLAGREGWQPAMNSFVRDSAGNWWYEVVGKGNKHARISVKDEYINVYMSRYRSFLGKSPTPPVDDGSALLYSLRGRPGLSEGHIRSIVQKVFDYALERMKSEGFSENDIDNLRSSSLHWLRHTSATADARYRDMKDLQADLRHESLATTTDTYYNSLDEQRHRSNKNLSIDR